MKTEVCQTAHALALAAALVAAPSVAQDYPTKPVRIVVTFPAGRLERRHGARAVRSAAEEPRASRSSSTTSRAPAARSRRPRSFAPRPMATIS